MASQPSAGLAACWGTRRGNIYFCVLETARLPHHCQSGSSANASRWAGGKYTDVFCGR